MIKSVIWASTLDYPGEIATVLFVGKCNWHCAYCHNADLNSKPSIDFDTVILPKLKERKHMVKSVVVSGGEPSVYGAKAIALIKQLHALGFKVALHTNGSNPSFIKQVLPFVTHISMDIKTSLDMYSRSTFIKFGISKLLANFRINRSMRLILNSGIKYEFRSTVSKHYFNNNTALNIAQALADYGVIVYFMQGCNGIPDKYRFSKEEFAALVDSSNAFVPTVWR